MPSLRIQEGGTVRLKALLLFGVFSISLLICASCAREGERTAGPKRLTVVTSLFPLYDFAKNIAGAEAEVILLLPPGVEPHGFEPTPGEIMRIHSADIFIYTGRFMEPWVEGIVKSVGSEKLVVVDSSKDTMLLEGPEGIDRESGDAEKMDSGVRGGSLSGHERGRMDPHIWLDLSNAQIMVDNILRGFLSKDPLHRDLYTRNAETYKRQLSELDRRFKDTFSHCQKDIFIHGGHFAFNYLTRRYNLRYLSAYRGSPDSEPTPKRIVELQESMKRHNVKYIFFEELITPRVAEVIARETGATLLRLHGAHNVTREELNGGITFLGIMEKNRENLARGLQCR